MDNKIAITKEVDPSMWCYPYKHVEYDAPRMGGIDAIGEYSDDMSLSVYYKYNINNKATYELGQIPGCSLYSGDLAQIGDKLYMYLVNPYGSYDKKIVDGQEKDICVLYEIDTAANTIKIIREELENIYPMIFVDVLGNALINNRMTRNADPVMSYMDLTVPTRQWPV